MKVGETLMRFIDAKTSSQASRRACGVWAKLQLLPVSLGGSRCVLFVGTEVCRWSCWPAVSFGHCWGPGFSLVLLYL